MFGKREYDLSDRLDRLWLYGTSDIVSVTGDEFVA